MRRTWLALLAVLVLATPMVMTAEGYLVFFKNGKFVRAQEPMKIKGKNAHIVLATGQLVMYPVDLIDLLETERYNQLGMGDAFLIEELTVKEANRATPTPTPSLGELAPRLGLGLSDEEQALAALPPTPTPTPGIRLQAAPYPNGRVTAAFQQFFDEKHIYLYKTSGGTQPDYFMIRATTDNEREVFATLKTVAEGFKLIRELHPEVAPAAIELEMVMTSGKPAGTFRITPDSADKIVTDKVTIEEFYFNNVIF